MLLNLQFRLSAVRFLIRIPHSEIPISQMVRMASTGCSLRTFRAGYSAAKKVIINTARGPLIADNQDSLGYMRPVMPNWLSSSDAPEKSMP